MYKLSYDDQIASEPLMQRNAIANNVLRDG
jgi:hypothetical protein